MLRGAFKGGVQPACARPPMNNALGTLWFWGERLWLIADSDKEMVSQQQPQPRRKLPSLGCWFLRLSSLFLGTSNPSLLSWFRVLGFGGNAAA